MQKLSLVKAIIKYTPYNFARDFVQGGSNKIHSTRYLLLQKAEDKFFPQNIGKWECSGGLIKPGETSEQTIIREVKKETGLEFRIVKQLPTLESDKSVCDVYLIEASSMDVRLSNEHLDYKWVKAEDVQKQELVLYADLLLKYFNNPEEYLD